MDGSRFYHKHKISFDAGELKHSAKLEFFADFSLLDTSQGFGVEGQEFSGLDRVGPGEMPNVEKITPTVVFDLLESTPDVPR